MWFDARGMPFENGVNWKPIAPEQRGRHEKFSSALEAAFKDLLVEKNPFFDSLADSWKGLFPNLPIWPGRYEGGKIWLYVRTAPTLFAMRSKLPMIKRTLATLPGAPKKLELRLEIHSS